MSWKLACFALSGLCVLLALIIWGMVYRNRNLVRALRVMAAASRATPTGIPRRESPAPPGPAAPGPSQSFPR